MELPPGPRSPGLWQLAQYAHAPLSFLEGCGKRYGDTFLVRWAWFGKFVMLSSPEAIADVFRGGPEALHTGEANSFLGVTVGNSSVLVLDEEPHARQRRILLPPLKGARMRSFFDAMQQATLDAVRAWPLQKPIDIVRQMQHITLRVILQAVLGLTPGEQLSDFERKVKRLLDISRTRYGFTIMPLLPTKLFKNSRWLPFFRHLREFDESLYAYIAWIRQQPPEKRPDCVLADLISTRYEDGKPVGDEEIRDAIFTLLLAGHDTTAVALAWALEQVVPRADVLQRLRNELRTVCSADLPSAAHLQQLEYLDAAIRESMRIRTVLPFVARLTKQPFVAGGRTYPPGIHLCACNHLVHRRADLFPQPDLFRPERFLERKFASHEWFPFGGGNRICLGMAFALYEMKVVLSTLLGRVTLTRPAGARSHPVRRGLSLAPDDGARMVLVERSNA